VGLQGVPLGDAASGLAEIFGCKPACNACRAWTGDRAQKAQDYASIRHLCGPGFAHHAHTTRIGLQAERLPPAPPDALRAPQQCCCEQSSSADTIHTHDDECDSTDNSHELATDIYGKVRIERFDAQR